MRETLGVAKRHLKFADREGDEQIEVLFVDPHELQFVDVGRIGLRSDERRQRLEERVSR
jgi:hypothetical protein